ncbi:MAG: nitrite/sulfite reductase, partial [Deltaproteobacteria bacterium]|nr:nitrite/sulfite reductase [Deltaproteobacteria bacterium]
MERVPTSDRDSEPFRQPSVTELLSYADERDIDELVGALQKLESGEWSPEEFRSFRLARGTYGQRQADMSMLRVKIPQGILTAEQLERLADVAEKYSRGFAHVTTRQNIQFHFMKLAEVPLAQRLLATSGLTTREACGHTVRNITACPMAGCCQGEAFDVTPHGQAVTRYFLRKAENQVLPRKFKIALSGCPSDCAMGAINDVGLIAKVKDGACGFQVKVAGGLSTTPEDAHELYDFVPADELIPVIEAVLALFNKHGNRQNKSRARLKYVVRKVGWAAFRSLFEEELATVQKAIGRTHPIDPTPTEILARSPSLPVVRENAGSAPGFERWRETNVTPQKQPGFFAVTVRLIRGDATAAQFRGLAALARNLGDGTARLTIDQNVLVRFISSERLPDFHKGLAAIGLAEGGAGTILDVASCPGAESCNLAVTASRELATALTQKLGNPGQKAPAVDAARDLSIKISGC